MTKEELEDSDIFVCDPNGVMFAAYEKAEAFVKSSAKIAIPAPSAHSLSTTLPEF